jgi:DNA-binding transcriptional LysR family regulator
MIGGWRMEIRQLRTFRTVASLLSFNRAADQLHYAQSSISAQIQALEEELGAQLFDRLGRRIMLTEAGTRLQQYADKIVNLADEALSEVAEAKEPRGTLTIRIPESFGVHRLPAVIREFHSRFPDVTLRFTTCAHEGLAKDLRKGITDLAFLMAESIQAADLMAEVLGFESLLPVSAPDHPLAAKRSVGTGDFAGETFLFSSVDCSYKRIFLQILDDQGVSHDRSINFHSVEALKKSVMAGVGITVLPEVAVAEEIARGKLVPLPWVEGRIEVAILMIWYKERWISPTLRAFMETTRAVMKSAS